MSRAHRHAGFTLVEVLIVLALSSLIMLGLTAALRSFGDTGARLDARSQHGEDMRLVSAFLRQSLTDASPRRRPPRLDGARGPYFAGDGATLEWLAPLPARHGVGGLHRLRLSVQEEPSQPFPAQRRLILQFVPFVVSESEVDWSAESAQVLLEGLESFAIQYQRLGAADWQEAWDDPAVLPGRVRLRIATAGPAWPELVIAPLAASPGQDLAGPEQPGEED
jgi:general secretion pathway protein J